MRPLVLLLAACGIAQLTCSRVNAQGMTPALQAAKADVANAGSADNVDPYQWLEDVDSARAMAWVNAENAKTLKVLESDPRYPDLHAAALKVAETQDRIPIPRFLANDIYNFWQDAEHVRGLWRKTSLAEYRNPTPRWSKVLDLDALAKSESANWVWEGDDCLHPSESRCLIDLSDGGEDAVTVREFDLPNRGFAPRGFELPKSKQTSTWVNHDQLLIASDFGPGTMTASGYPYIVKSLTRGEPFSAAREVFRGKPEDVEVDVGTWVDGSGNTAVVISRGVSFFESKYYLVRPAGPQQLDIPSEVRDQGAARGSTAVHDQRTVGRERRAFRSRRIAVPRFGKGDCRPAASASDAGLYAGSARVASRGGGDPAPSDRDALREREGAARAFSRPRPMADGPGRSSICPTTLQSPWSMPICGAMRHS